MKLIIAGSRTLSLRSDTILDIVNVLKIPIKRSISEIVSGGARCIDQSGEMFARRIEMKLKLFPADWDKHGRSAGIIRNKQMAEYADALLLIWSGESNGSANMRFEMQKLNKPTYEVVLREVK